MRLALGPPGMEPEVTFIIVLLFAIIKDYSNLRDHPPIVYLSREGTTILK